MKYVGREMKAGVSAVDLRERITALAESPRKFVDDPDLGTVATGLVDLYAARETFQPRETPAPYRQWGTDLEPQAVQQMIHACDLPVAVRGALMPDAHLGYGLPIGGVLATRGAVIPYAVGVDIACRVKLSLLDLPADLIEKSEDRLIGALEKETRFGIGAKFRDKREHDVLDRDWSVSPITEKNIDRAHKQLGTSGGGNHFVEFGTVELTAENDWGLAAGEYLALLSHSGSRGTGLAVANEYSKRAMAAHPELPKELRHLAWLDLDSADGQEYWAAMELMGEYASANHACIHKHVTEHLGAEVLLDLENHHNFAWKEVHDGEELIVHRKGATPAGDGVYGIIPGSMASSTYIVRGRGDASSLNSAAHGAGRVMSRTKANQTFRWGDVKPMLAERRVKLLSSGLDEVPGVYKDIHEVMDAQSDLVEPLAQFEPRIVKMAPAGSGAED